MMEEEDRSSQRSEQGRVLRSSKNKGIEKRKKGRPKMVVDARVDVAIKRLRMAANSSEGTSLKYTDISEAFKRIVRLESMMS